MRAHSLTKHFTLNSINWYNYPMREICTHFTDKMDLEHFVQSMLY